MWPLERILTELHIEMLIQTLKCCTLKPQIHAQVYNIGFKGLGLLRVQTIWCAGFRPVSLQSFRVHGFVWGFFGLGVSDLKL